MYAWQKLTSAERAEILASRRRNGSPCHGPPHWRHDEAATFHLTAACYRHEHHIGADATRMTAFVDALLDTVNAQAAQIHAWCVLPNHYHLLIRCTDLRNLTRSLGRLHGRTSREWNLQDVSLGRKVFHRASDRRIRSEPHFWATMNYIHHNPVRHGYVAEWTAWPWSSAAVYLDAVGRDEALRIWRAYPVLQYGAGWDEPSA